MKKSTVKFPAAVSEILCVASDATAGAVFKAIMSYVESGTEPTDLAPDALCIFKFAIKFIRRPKPKTEEKPLLLPAIKGDIPDDIPGFFPLVKLYMPEMNSRKEVESLLRRVSASQAVQLYYEYKYLIFRNRYNCGFDKHIYFWMSDCILNSPKYKEVMKEFRYNDKLTDEYDRIISGRIEARKLLREQTDQMQA